MPETRCWKYFSSSSTIQYCKTDHAITGHSQDMVDASCSQGDGCYC
ncbi:MAG: hypothetical protein ACLTMR_01975 [Faecalibacillus sp.]